MPMRVQPCVHSETELRETLDQLYEASKQGKSFTGILELAMCEITIITAIHNIKANDGAHTPGADRMEIDNYLQMPYKRTIGLVQSAFRRYDPRPVRRVYIPKRNGKMRPLGIPAMVDRIVQECIRIVLEPILEARFFEHSYGFRPYRATRHAVKHVQRHAADSPWVIEGDIKGYFGAPG
jgi:retron-type reverse transcriptase